MEGVFLFGCPLTGEVAPISQCSDPTFAQGMLGPGAVIRPAGCQVLAPACLLYTSPSPRDTR